MTLPLSNGGARAKVTARNHMDADSLLAPTPNAINFEFCCACRWHRCCC